MAMTKKQFNKLAEALKVSRLHTSKQTAESERQWEMTCERIAAVCTYENGNFDTNRFYAACGYTS